MKTSYDIIKTLVRTEKGTSLEPQRQYLFEVDRKANKVEIRKAVEEVYKVKVQAVNTIVVPGKPKQVRRELGYTSSWKKAIVTLQEGQKIEAT